MSLMKSIEEDEAKLKEAEEKEAEEAKVAAEDDKAEEGEDDKAEEGEDDKAEEGEDDKAEEGEDDKKETGDKKEKAEGDEDDKAEEGEDGKKKANSEAAKRRIKERLEKEAKEARENKTTAQTQPKPEPKKAEDAKTKTVEEEVAELRADKERREQAEAQARLYSDAVGEFNSIEENYEKENPDYKEASTHTISAMIQGYMYANPAATEQQALRHVQQQVLTIASQAVQRGENPAARLHLLAYERYGYEPKTAPKDDKKENAKAAADALRKSQKTKRRSATGLSSGGQNTSSSVTVEEGLNMDLASFSKLSTSDIDEMIGQASS